MRFALFAASLALCATLDNVLSVGNIMKEMATRLPGTSINALYKTSNTMRGYLNAQELPLLKIQAAMRKVQQNCDDFIARRVFFELMDIPGGFDDIGILHIERGACMEAIMHLCNEDHERNFITGSLMLMFPADDYVVMQLSLVCPVVFRATLGEIATNGMRLIPRYVSQLKVNAGSYVPQGVEVPTFTATTKLIIEPCTQLRTDAVELLALITSAYVEEIVFIDKCDLIATTDFSQWPSKLTELRSISFDKTMLGLSFVESFPMNLETIGFELPFLHHFNGKDEAIIFISRLSQMKRLKRLFLNQLPYDVDLSIRIVEAMPSTLKSLRMVVPAHFTHRFALCFINLLKRTELEELELKQVFSNGILNSLKPSLKKLKLEKLLSEATITGALLAAYDRMINLEYLEIADFKVLDANSFLLLSSLPRQLKTLKLSNIEFSLSQVVIPCSRTELELLELDFVRLQTLASVKSLSNCVKKWQNLRKITLDIDAPLHFKKLLLLDIPEHIHVKTSGIRRSI